MKITKQIKIRDVLVGGGAPIAVQSMTNTDTRDAKATLAQIRALADAGCDIVRCAVPDMQAAEALRGAEVYVDRRHAIKLGTDENFVCELIGLRAVDETGETIGTLRDVLKPNAVCDVYVFDTPRGELMIPALKRVVKTVDVDAGVMTLDSAALAEVAVWEDEPAERDE